MQYYPFDSRNPLYKSQIGAVAAGSPLRLRLLLHNDAKCHDAFLRVRNDSFDTINERKLTPKEWLGDYRFYDCEITPDEGLYWYSFRYTSDYGDFFVTKTETSLGIVSSEGNWWQMTVYNSDYETPDWLLGGIIYQIFPDRFYSSGEEKQNVPDDRFLCSDWRKIPEHRQTEDKCRLSNDYYGGDLKGIKQKLPYLKSLGVNCIYLNPIFEAHSNHRYNTADYMKIDPLLGDEKELEDLCKSAEKQGISVILDGVFSHTGDDSVYFNRKGRYDSNGAYQNYDSPYHNWYKFESFPDKYASWWGIDSLPETDESNPSFSEFITGENGVLRKWIRKGIRGWRLDVADELPDDILDKIRTAVKSEREDAYLLGEVWEDASNKISYGKRRRFLRGRQLDSVMNYPFANAIIDFVCNGNSENLENTVLDVLENYPPCSVNLLMNHIGTHDTVRIITRLSDSFKPDYDRETQSRFCLSKQEYKTAKGRLKLAAVLQYTLPGIPSLFYGDEAGVQGFSDPFCRAAYPWGNEDKELVEFYSLLGNFRRNCKAFCDGKFVPFCAGGDAFAFERVLENSSVFVAVNRGDSLIDINIPREYLSSDNILGDIIRKDGIKLNPKSFFVAEIKSKKTTVA